MAHLSFEYKGYKIFLANIQPSKVRRGGKKRTMQVRDTENIIKKSIRYDRTDPYGHSKASKKACEWIDKNPS